LGHSGGAACESQAFAAGLLCASAAVCLPGASAAVCVSEAHVLEYMCAHTTCCRHTRRRCVSKRVYTSRMPEAGTSCCSCCRHAHTSSRCVCHMYKERRRIPREPMHLVKARDVKNASAKALSQARQLLVRGHTYILTLLHMRPHTS
jgi:hypothetical protein